MTEKEPSIRPECECPNYNFDFCKYSQLCNFEIMGKYGKNSINWNISDSCNIATINTLNNIQPNLGQYYSRRHFMDQTELRDYRNRETFKLTIEDYEKIYSECVKERIKN